MKTIKKLLVLASFVIAGTLFVVHFYLYENPGTAEDLAEIKQVFNDFKQALTDESGSRAVDLVDQATLERIKKLQLLALEATKEELDAEPLAHQFYVMMLRMNLSPRALAVMSPREVGVYLLGNRILGNFFEDRSHIDRIEVRGRYASARHMKLKWQVGDPLAFVRESDHWRFRLLPMIDEVNGQMQTLADKTGNDAQELMYRIIEFISMKRIKKDHFLPVKGEL